MVFRIHIQGTHLVAGIAATAQEDAGMASVQIRCTKVMLARSVTRIIRSPCGSIIGFTILETRERIVHR